MGLSLPATVLVGAADASSYASAPGPSESRPNVLIIVTDDQRADTMSVMPETLRLFGEQGVRYTNGFANTPLCCPARASIFTGQFAHNHGIETNDGPAGLDHGTTVQRYLQDAGYRTGVVGKYFNHWPADDDPPYFDRWTITGDKTYDHARYNVDGDLVSVDQYSTDFVADASEGLIRDFEEEDSTPWFLQVAPIAPHLPVSVAPEYESAPVEPWDPPPSVSRIPDPEVTDGVRRMLMSVDDLVAQIFKTLDELVESENTLAFFTSDNGFMWGEHSLWAKNKPYSESINVPFFARWPGPLPAGTIEQSPVGHVDIAPTIMHAAGLSPSGAMDGTSLLEASSRTEMLTEAWGSTDTLIWASLRTDAYQYIERFGDDGQTVTSWEFYRLDDDPWQLVNLLADPTTAGEPDVDGLHARLARALACMGTAETSGCAPSLTSTSLEVDDVTTSEGGGQATFNVTLSRTTPTDVHVPYSTGNGTATSSADYTSVSGTLLIPAGEDGGQITVPLVDDSMDEVDETVFLDLSSATNATVIDGAAVATIIDDDPEPSLWIDDTSVTEGSGGETFSVSLSSLSGKDISVMYATRNGTATSSADYTSVSGTLLIPAGEDGGQITVPLVDDSMDEVDETVFLDLSSATNATVIDGAAVATIIDDDPVPALSIADVDIAEGDKGSSKARFTVALSAPSGNTVNVKLSTADGTAQAGRDYALTSEALSLPPGVSSGTMSVRILGDAVVEGDETFVVALSEPAMATIADGEAIGTILNDDTPPPPPPPQPSVSLSDVSVAEGHANTVDADFTVTLSGPAPTDVLLSYRTTDGTGTGGLDYHSTTGTLRIPAGESVGVISVPVVGDTLDEPQEDFTLSLTTVSGATIADGTAVGTIFDDDEPPTVSITDASAVESDSMITFAVALSAPSGGTVSVAYATANGTAMSGKDYKRVLGTLKIPAGQTTATISAPLLNDALDETDERFSVLLSSPSGTTISDGEGVGTIIDDDPVP